jgi:hypothetical protein
LAGVLPPDKPRPVVTRPVVTIKPPTRVVVAPGGSSEARLNILINEGFHLQANPASQEYLVPTKVEVERASDVWPGRPVYPPGRPYRLQGAASDLAIYDGNFEIHVPIEASNDATPGDRSLHGTLHYQACDTRICLKPASVEFALTVRIRERLAAESPKWSPRARVVFLRKS